MWLPDQSRPLWGGRCWSTATVKHACRLPPASFSISLFNQSLVRIQEWIRYGLSAKDISRARTAFYISRHLLHIKCWVFQCHSYVTYTKHLVLSNISMDSTAFSLFHCPPRKKHRACFGGIVRPAHKGRCVWASIFPGVWMQKHVTSGRREDLMTPLWNAQVDESRDGSANYGLLAKARLPSVAADKVLLALGHMLIHQPIVLGCFCTEMQGWVAARARSIYCLAIYRKNLPTPDIKRWTQIKKKKFFFSN